MLNMLNRRILAALLGSTLVFGAPALVACEATDTGSAETTQDAADNTTDEAMDDITGENLDAADTTTASDSNVGKTVKVDYIGTLEDGTEFDNSYTRGQPLEFVVGSGQMIPGFDAAVADMEVGETKVVTLSPEEAYGDRDEGLVRTYPLTQLPGADELEVGESTYLNMNGQPVAATVVARDGNTITFDFNPRLAGETLVFEITLDEVED